jgi:apolipoprotein N-acyltransferase
MAGVVPPPQLDWLTAEDLQLPVDDPGLLRTKAAESVAASHKIQDWLFAQTEKEAHAGARVVVWSEMATWVPAEEESALVDHARILAHNLDIDLVIAVASLHLADERVLDNKAILLTPDGSISWQYRKRHPVPGTEEALSIKADGRPRVASTIAGRLGSAICFDMDYPRTIRTLAGGGVDVLVVPSHDFQTVRETHVRMAVLRAIENGVALFRPVADGVSIATDAYGRTLASVGYLRSGGASLIAQIPVRGVRTVYSRWGDWFAWVSVAAWVGLLVKAVT